MHLSMICLCVSLSLLAIAGSSVKVCARAATVGVQGDCEVVVASVGFPSLQRLPLDRTRVRSGEQWRRRTSYLVPWSPPPLYGTARQGPTSLAWAGRPRSGRGSRVQWAVGPIGEEINLTFSPLISSYTFNFIL